MKKILFALAVVLLTCCSAPDTACKAQAIPDQYIMTGDVCSAPIADYTGLFKYIDNCAVDGVAQFPSVGTVLNGVTTPVTITATDGSGNQSSVSFNVILIDTIPPSIFYNDSLVSYHLEDLNKIYSIFKQGMRANFRNLNKVDSFRMLQSEEGDSLMYWNNVIAIYPEDQL